MARGALAPLMALWAAACGSGAGAAGGTGALAIDCEVFYSPTDAPLRRAAADTTYVRLSVRRGEGPAEGARAHLTDLDRQESLALAGDPGELGGHWRGYRRHLALEVRADDDFVSATHQGPARHIVTRPATGALRAGGRSLEVAWRKDPGDAGDDADASRTDLSLASGYLATTARQEMDIKVPAGELAAGTDVVEVVRHRDLAPAGAQVGSRFRISYGVAVPIVVE